MTENEYIIATALARVNIAKEALSKIVLVNNVMTFDEFSNVYDTIGDWEIQLYNLVKID